MAPQPAGHYVLGVDLGTTGVRAVVFDAAGRQQHVESAEYPLAAPFPGWAEQDPEQVYTATVRCLRAAAAWARRQRQPIVALGWSAILHSLVPLDAEGNALGPSIIWADARSAAEAGALRREIDPLRLYHRTGCPIHAMYWPAKLRWLQRYQPDVWRRAASFAGIKEYVVRRCLGFYGAERSSASATGLFNLHTMDWDDQALALAGVERARLPPLVEPVEPCRVPPDRLRVLGLPESCLVVPGAGDGVLQTIGTGTIHPDQMVAMVATSGAIRTVSSTPRTDPRGRTWCYYLAEGRWVVGTAINNAGLVYAWLRDQLNGAARDAAAAETGGPPPSITPADLDRWAAAVPAGSNGLVFLPYLAGERSPNWNADARGVLFGLSLAHDYRHLARATLEGVAYRMRTILEPMEEVAGRAAELRAAGGFVRSPLWLQIVADVLNRELALVDSPEASALGAAQLAMRAAGMVARFEDLGSMVTPSGRVFPQPEPAARYARLYALYQRLYERLASEFPTIAALQAELSGA